MTDLDVVINAITTGAGLVATGLASAATRDAYQELKKRLRPHLADDDAALAELDSATPRSEVLRARLTAAVGDPGVVEAARACAAKVTHQHFDTKDSPGSVFGPHGNVVVHNYIGGAKAVPSEPAST